MWRFFSRFFANFHSPCDGRRTLCRFRSTTITVCFLFYFTSTVAAAAIVVQLLIVVVVVVVVVVFYRIMLMCIVLFAVSPERVAFFSYESLGASPTAYLYTHFCSTGFPIIGRIVTLSPVSLAHRLSTQSIGQTDHGIGHDNTDRCKWKSRDSKMGAASENDLKWFHASKESFNSHFLHLPSSNR